MSVGAALLSFPLVLLQASFWSILIPATSSQTLPFSLLIVLVLTTRFDHRLVGPVRISVHQIASGTSSSRSSAGVIGAALFLNFSFHNDAAVDLPAARHRDLELDQRPHRSSRKCRSSSPRESSSRRLPLLAGVFWLLFAKMDRT
jgi:hypothetical protein